MLYIYTIYYINKTLPNHKHLLYLKVQFSKFYKSYIKILIFFEIVRLLNFAKDKIRINDDYRIIYTIAKTLEIQPAIQPMIFYAIRSKDPAIIKELDNFFMKIYNFFVCILNLCLCKKISKQKESISPQITLHRSKSVSSKSSDTYDLKMKSLLKYDSPKENKMNESLLNVMSNIKKRYIISTILTFIREIYSTRIIPDDSINYDFDKVSKFLVPGQDQIEHYSLKRRDYKNFNENIKSNTLDSEVDVYHPEKFINLFLVAGFDDNDLRESFN